MSHTEPTPIAVVSRDGPDIVIAAGRAGYWRLCDEEPARAILRGLKQRGHALAMLDSTDGLDEG